jgi:hypothetical protein
MALDPTTKLARVREAMAAGDWEVAISLASKLRSLGKYQKDIDRAKDFLNHPAMYEQLGYNRTEVIEAAIAALKSKFSKSWAAIQQGKIEARAQKRPRRRRGSGKA